MANPRFADTAAASGEQATTFQFNCLRFGLRSGGGLLSAGQWRSPAKIGTAAPAYHSAKIGTAAPVYHSAPGAGMPVVALVEGYLRKPKG